MNTWKVIPFLLFLSTSGCGFYHSKIQVEDLAATAEPVEPTFESIHDRIFKPKCLQCHITGATSKAAQFPLDAYAETMANFEYVLPGDPAGSEIYKSTKKGKMPTKKSKIPLLTAQELEAIRQWIADGAKP